MARWTQDLPDERQDVIDVLLDINSMCLAQFSDDVGPRKETGRRMGGVVVTGIQDSPENMDICHKAVCGCLQMT